MMQEQAARNYLYLISCEQNALHSSILKRPYDDERRQVIAHYRYLQTSGLHNVGGPEFSADYGVR